MTEDTGTFTRAVWSIICSLTPGTQGFLVQLYNVLLRAEIVCCVMLRVESVSCASGSDVTSHQWSAEWPGTPEQWTSTCGESGTGPGVRQDRCYTTSRLLRQGPCLTGGRIRSYRRDGRQWKRRIWSWEKKKRKEIGQNYNWKKKHQMKNRNREDGEETGGGRGGY